MLDPKIQYNYIPKKHSNKIPTIALLDIQETDNYEDFYIIDNIEKGIHIYPREFNLDIERCRPTELIKKIHFALENGYRIIVVNDFEIDFDTMKETIMPSINKYDAVMYINNLIDLELEDRIIIDFSADILTLKENEWNEIKEKANNMLSLKESDFDYELDEDGIYDFDTELTEDQKDELSKLFNLKDFYLEEKDKSKIEDLESYSHSLGDSRLTVSFTEEKVILCNEELEYIEIPKIQIPFLINTLKNIN